MHRNTNPMNKQLLEAIYDKIPNGYYEEYYSTQFILDLFATRGFILNNKDFTYNSLHNFLSWCKLRQIIYKKKDNGKLYLRINQEQLKYYLKRFKEDGKRT